MKMNIGISLDHTLIVKIYREKSGYQRHDQTSASVLPHLNSIPYSDQTKITFKLLGMKECILGILTFLLVSPGRC